MWKLDEVHEILRLCTKEYRKGDAVIMTPGVTEVFAMPPIPSPPNDWETVVDCHFIAVGVDNALAKENSDRLVALLNDFPGNVDLHEGPSYIAVGAVLESQSAAFRLFALGEVLGLWGVMTPLTLGITGEFADKMAGAGMIMISGYNPSEPSA